MWLSMSKKIWELSDEEMDVIVKEAARKAIAETHAAGRPSTHGDDNGIYRLYPDGRKEYIELYEKNK
jgi:hypothetical protein